MTDATMPTTTSQRSHADESPLLRVEDLRVSFPSRTGTIHAVNGVSFSVASGQRLGIAGESGSGKTVTALSVLRLLPEPPATVTGRVLFHGQDLASAGPRLLRRVRGSGISMIFQDPRTCLSPRLSVGAQIIESIRAHGGVRRRSARERAVELLAQVGMPAPRARMSEYPHRLSGGMAQRVMIAMALAGEPELIIADEPTTAIDVSIQAQIIELLLRLSEERGTAVVLITHDLGVLARFVDDIAVMYAGRIVEFGPVHAVYRDPVHPYTAGLLASATRADAPTRGNLQTIAGAPPSPLALPDGCAFHPRCPHAVDRCLHERPRTRSQGGGRDCACHLADERGRQLAGPQVQE